MEKRILLGALAVTLAALAVSACTHDSPRVTVQFPGAPPLQAEVADEPAERERGLMFRAGLAPGEAMLFVFPDEQRWGFWMKNVQFPIDIVWLSANGTVVHVWQAPPCLAEPCPIQEPPGPALYVVEVPAGFSANHSIVSGTAAVVPGGLRSR